MKKNMRRLLVGSGIAAAGVGLTGLIHGAVTRYFVDVALNRSLPRHTHGAEQRLSGGEADRKVMEKLRFAGDELKKKGGETVHITARDGVLLVGHWFAGEHPKRIVVAMHGWRSDWSRDFGVIADFWLEQNCALLLPQQRGQGDSGGAYMGFGLLERYDCLSWVHWVNERTGGEVPVYLCGVSMGASTVLMAAGLELPGNVHGIIADCGYSSPAEIWKHVAKDNLKLSYGLRRGSANDLCRKKIQVGIDDYSCLDAMAECEVPVLFIHGTEDRFVPIEMTYENYKACAAPKRLFIVPGAGHGMSYLLDPQGYQRAMLQFWEEFDE